MKLKLFRNFLFVAIVGAFVASCMDNADEYTPPTKAEETAILNEYLDTLENRGMDFQTTDLGVYYYTDSVGNGYYPETGDTCVVKYTGFLINGYVFDASSLHNEEGTFEFILGESLMIEGWDDGVKMIDEKGQAYLIIPSEFAYGTTGNRSIPPNTTLVFHIEMVEIKSLD